MGDFVIATISSGDGCGSGDLLFSWHMEDESSVTAGTPPGCSVAATVPSKTGSPSITTSPGSPSFSGTNSAYINGSTQQYGFTVSSEDIVNHTSGTLNFWVYVTTYGSDSALVTYENTGAPTSQIRVRMHTATTQQFQLNYSVNGGGTQIAANTTITSGFSNNTWYHVIARWDSTAHSGHYLSISADTSTGEGNPGYNDTSLPTWTGTTPKFYFGTGSTSSTYYIDEHKTYGVWK